MRVLCTGEGTTSDIALKQVYGLYLLNGGTRDRFDEMTDDDVQLMYSSYIGTMTYLRRELVKDLVKIIHRMFGGGK